MTITEAHIYLRGLMEGRPRDDHARIQHAAPVKNATFAIAGAILCYCDDPAYIHVRESHLGGTNTGWFTCGRRRLCAIYNHNTQSIDIRDRSHRGPTLFSVNDSNMQIVQPSFALLKSGYFHRTRAA
jgi:hypothetical protein